MANKTRTNIISQVYEYIPKMNVTSHDTTLDNLIDLAAEEISLRHNFTYLAANAPATHAVAANEYYIDEADLSFTNLKEILYLQWIVSARGESGKLKWIPFREYQQRFPYVEYSGNTDGKPVYYTKYGNRIFFNCQLDEAVTMRAFYQKTHGVFATVHLFQPDNIGFQAIVACVLSECRELLPGLEWSQAAIQALEKKELWIQQLIKHDMVNSDEDIEMEPAHRKDYDTGAESPYSWV
jgi:hypothetical protein